MAYDIRATRYKLLHASVGAHDDGLSGGYCRALTHVALHTMLDARATHPVAIAPIDEENPPMHRSEAAR